MLELAAEYGTPLFVYDEAHLRARCREAVAAFGDDVAYASKAFLCTAMARLAHDEGMRIDVATGGELHVALAAGVARVAAGAARQQQVRGRAGPGPGRAASGSSSSTRSTSCDRIEQLVTSDGYSVPRVHGARHAGRRGPHPRVRPHRPGRLEVRLHAVHRRRGRSGEAGARVAGRRARRASTSTSGRRSSWPTSSARPSTPSPPSSRRSTSPSCRSAAASGVAYVEGEVAPTITEWGDGRARRGGRVGRHRPGERRAGSGDRGVGRDHPLHRGHRSRRSRASAPTWRSTAA